HGIEVLKMPTCFPLALIVARILSCQALRALRSTTSTGGRVQARSVRSLARDDRGFNDGFVGRERTEHAGRLLSFIQCTHGNPEGRLAEDLLCTLQLISCINAHLYGSIGEHRVERLGEATVTGEAVFESDAVLRVLEGHTAEVQAYAHRARQLQVVAALEQDPWRSVLADDLDRFVQTMIQE